MNAEVKAVAVIGGGIVGLCVAWRAAQKGCAVTVFDQAVIGSEASWAGAGMLAPGGEIEDDSEFSEQLVSSRARYSAFVRELASESGHEIEFHQTGALDLTYSERECVALRNRADVQTRLGIQSRPVSVDEIAVNWPHVRMNGLLAARLVPGDAVVDPRSIVAALRTACERRGIIFLEHTRVRRICVASSTYVNELRFDAAVIAAGAWSSQIEVAGVPALPVSEPVRGHLVGYQQPPGTLMTIVRNENVYLLQRASGLLIAGASIERVGFNRDIDRDVVRNLELSATAVLPHLGEATPAEIWNGFRPGAEELHVRAWHSPRLLLAYGHYRNGILLAPSTGDRIASLL